MMLRLQIKNPDSLHGSILYLVFHYPHSIQVISSKSLIQLIVVSGSEVFWFKLHSGDRIGGFTPSYQLSI